MFQFRKWSMIVCAALVAGASLAAMTQAEIVVYREVFGNNTGSDQLLSYAGWNLHYEDYRLFGDYSLPRRIEMSRAEDNISLTFVGLNWNFEDF